MTSKNEDEFVVWSPGPGQSINQLKRDSQSTLPPDEFDITLIQPQRWYEEGEEPEDKPPYRTLESF